MFKYIEDSKAFGMSQLDPWNGHLAPLVKEDEHLKAHDPEAVVFSTETQRYIAQVKAKADELELPLGCLAVDGAHIYWDTPEERRATRVAAYRWLDAARTLGAARVRIDAGGPEAMPDDVFAIIVAAYGDSVSIRKLPDPYGAMDLLFLQLMLRLKEEGFYAFSLGLAQFSGVGNEPGATLEERAVHQLFEHLSRFFSYKGPRSYKEKFGPQWTDSFRCIKGAFRASSEPGWRCNG